MDFLRRRLTYANVLATLALFFALGGTSYAVAQLPANSVGTKQLRTNAVTLIKINAKTRKALDGQRGPRGPKGDTGAPGSNATINGVAAGGDLTGTYPNPTIANGTVTAAKLAPTPAFQDMTLENGWTKFAPVLPTYYNTPGFTKDALGFVHLRGALDGSAMTATTFAHLPAGFRPPAGQFNWFAVAGTNGDGTPRPVGPRDRERGRRDVGDQGRGLELQVPEPRRRHLLRRLDRKATGGLPFRRSPFYDRRALSSART